MVPNYAMHHMELGFVNWIRHFQIDSKNGNLQITACTYTYALREKYPNTEFFVVCILPYSVQIREKTDQKKLRIWTLSTQ